MSTYRTTSDITIDNSLPTVVNVTKVVTYRVADIVKDIVAEREDTEDVTIGEVLERIEEYVKDDFSCGWGHEADTDELIYTNENGEEL
jgi:hypothetical protein